LKKLKDWKYSFDTLTQLSLENNGKDTSGFHIDGILPGDIHVSPIQLNRVIFHEVNGSRYGVFLLYAKYVLKGKQCARYSYF
jgi:hypothetical protein